MSWHITYLDEHGAECVEALSPADVMTVRLVMDEAEGLPVDPDLDDPDDDGDAA